LLSPNLREKLVKKLDLREICAAITTSSCKNELFCGIIQVSRKYQQRAINVIPDFNQRGELPPGIYKTTLQEIKERYGHNEVRGKLLEGLEQALNNLREANVT